MSTTIPVYAKCGACGEPISPPDNTPDNAVLICAKCGANLGTYLDIKNHATKAVQDRIESMFDKLGKR